MSGKDEYTIKGAKKKKGQNTWGSKNSSTTGHYVMHQSERDWCNNSQARLLHSISFRVGRVSEWGVNWGSRWTSRCTGRSRATSLVPSLCLTLPVFLSALPHLSLLPPPVHRSGWEPGTNLPVHLIEQTWEPDNLTPSGENKAGMLADKQHQHHPTASKDPGIPPISVEEVMNICVHGGEEVGHV